MFGKCKVCAVHELRIADLKAQMEMLKGLVLPTNTGNKPSAHQLEADGILSGQQHVIEVHEEEAKETFDELVERDRLLSGTYS
jgi:hypothetical protein